MNPKLTYLCLVLLLGWETSLPLAPAAGFVAQRSSNEAPEALTQADRWFFIAKRAIYDKGDFDTAIINFRRSQESTTSDCVRRAATQALIAAQSGKAALKSGVSVKEAIALYTQQMLGSAECW